MFEKKDWREFQDNGLLWLVNKALMEHGWAIATVHDTRSGKLESVYPVKVGNGEFSAEANEIGRQKFLKFVEKNKDDAPKDSKKFKLEYSFYKVEKK